MIADLIYTMLQDGSMSTWLIRHRLEKYHNIDINNKELRNLLESMESVERDRVWSRSNNIIWRIVK